MSDFFILKPSKNSTTVPLFAAQGSPLILTARSTLSSVTLSPHRTFLSSGLKLSNSAWSSTSRSLRRIHLPPISYFCFSLKARSASWQHSNNTAAWPVFRPSSFYWNFTDPATMLKPSKNSAISSSVALNGNPESLRAAYSLASPRELSAGALLISTGFPLSSF